MSKKKGFSRNPVPTKKEAERINRYLLQQATVKTIIEDAVKQGNVRTKVKNGEMLLNADDVKALCDRLKARQ